MYLTLLCQNIDCRFQGRRCSISSLSHQCHEQVFGIVFHFDIAVADAEQFRLGAAEWPSHHNENITLAILQIPGGLGSVGRFPSEFPMPLFAPAPPDPYPEMNVVDQVRLAARADPAKDAVVMSDQRMDWATFDGRINQTANALRDLGVDTGDRVAVLAATSVEYIEIFMGTLRAGACLVPLSTMASPDALHRMVTDSGSKVFFLSETMRELATPFAGNLPALLPGGRIAIDFDTDGWASYDGFVGAASTTDPMIPIGYDDPFNIIYSSGTTGVPKGILHDHLLRAVQMTQVADRGYEPDCRTQLSTPLYSNTTIVALLPTLVIGGTVVLMQKFDARKYLELAAHEKCTNTMLVPVQYKRIMDVPDFDSFDLSSMRAKFSTSAPLRADLKRDVLDRFPGGLTEYYGLTEGGGTTILRAHETPHKLHTVGEPAQGHELRFIDEAGTEVGPGETGEICGRSPAMMTGYFGREDLTSEYLWTAPDGKVFFRSGDMGFMDEDGFVHLTDRKKDMIISGGLNIFANDLELALLACGDVEDAAVIGIPSDQWGETPLGLIVMNTDSRRTPDEILAETNDRLGKSQRLSGIEFRDSLPRSSIGKILKRELRAPYFQTASAFRRPVLEYKTPLAEANHRTKERIQT